MRTDNKKQVAMSNVVSISTADRRWLLSNYGGFFQHYALRDVLKRMGFSPYRVDMGGVWAEVFGYVIRVLKDCCNNVLCIVFPSRRWREIKVLSYWIPRFKFIRGYHQLIGKVFEPDQGDCRCAAIVGGGQAWSIYCQDRPDLYWEDDERDFLRIAYSVSSSWRSLQDNESWLLRVARACQKSDAISLREQAGVELVSTVQSSVVPVVTVDPVFLLTREDYCEKIPQETIFYGKTLWCYLLEVHDKDYLDIEKLRRLADALGVKLRMTGIQGAERYIPRGIRIIPSPSDFLRCFRDCDYFITNSFHGAAFALIFNRQFLYLGQREKREGGDGANLRQMELLERYGLKSRIMTFFDQTDDLVGKMENRVEWGDVNMKMESLRIESLKWLQNALNREPKTRTKNKDLK